MNSVMISHPDHASDFYMPFYCPAPVATVAKRQSAAGYGKKIPTNYMLKYMGRDRRIYADCAGLSVAYIIVNKEKVFVH